ncbi:MAG: thioredoxin domain-containing protein [Parachlamydiaceae bacterium]|nr:thioredoxin domain-containing protein [Parachlamydiaceae bacterium]
MEDNIRYTNRLIKEKSPYLLQHAHNPVDWYPWGDEAFEASRNENKPIFLSIGYSTCHWCHVMEKESFENPHIASAMNEAFINIKVDREELPGVDSLYMEFAQSMISGASGWPLNVMLTPELHPFFAATYLPPFRAHGMMGLSELIEQMSETWNNEEEREQLENQSNYIMQLYAKSFPEDSVGEILYKEEAIEAAEILFRMTDPVHGGIRGEPKFPLGYYINFLLTFSATKKDSRALFIVERTLEMMHRGGIYDHLGGGFSRYSIDENWFLPHFEKMLYDNALLAKAYFEGWQATKKPLYKQVSTEILNYLIRDMMHPGGGFYAAEDADSEGHEGYFYTWPYNEVMQLLGDSGKIFCKYYGINKDGNFEDRNILHLSTSLDDFAEKNGLNFEEFTSLITSLQRKLWAAREKRVHPHKDTKIIASWNGLLIDALATAADPEDTQQYLQAAINTANFIKQNLFINQRLKRSWCDGQVSLNGVFEDYAAIIKGSITLFEANAGTEWLQWAIDLCKIVDELFKSPQGAYFQTSTEEKNIILRRCHFSDGAEPSGNSLHCENLLRLYDITHDDLFLSNAEGILKASEEQIRSYPVGFIYALMNINRFHTINRTTIVIALNKTSSLKEEIAELLYGHYIPHKSVIWRREDDVALLELIPELKLQGPINGETTLYICHQGRCLKPLTNLTEMKAAAFE